MRSGRWAWMSALKPRPFLQLVLKFSMLTPGYLRRNEEEIVKRLGDGFWRLDENAAALNQHLSVSWRKQTDGRVKTKRLFRLKGLTLNTHKNMTRVENPLSSGNAQSENLCEVLWEIHRDSHPSFLFSLFGITRKQKRSTQSRPNYRFLSFLAWTRK